MNANYTRPSNFMCRDDNTFLTSTFGSDDTKKAKR